ncbi:MAG: methylated-DNA-[protein]-cysteine S-methyltransferase [Pirellulaceae bacterium]|jgi:methylated-DNA-[protein]-cysteine S-methyltransferase
MEVVDNSIICESPFGWICAVWTAKGLYGLSFGTNDPQAALDRVTRPEVSVEPKKPHREVVSRVLAFLSTANDSFLDLKIDHHGRTEFQGRVLEACRRIKAGSTMSYGELAAKAKSPRAARAVGSTMASNRIPLIIPCHRVVAAGGKIGGFSAPDGIDMKRRLLAAEGEL